MKIKVKKCNYLISIILRKLLSIKGKIPESRFVPAVESNPDTVQPLAGRAKPGKTD
jgi:hypothetical protein